MIFIGLTLGITDTGIPVWMEEFSDSFGEMGIPTILFCMGLSISLRDAFKSTRPLLPYLMIRTLSWIGVTFLLTRIPLYDKTSVKVLVINSLAPLGINPIIMSDMFGLDSEFVAHSITVSTVLFLIGLPILFLVW
jgi:predicted permease